MENKKCIENRSWVFSGARDLKRSRKFNITMIVSILAMLAAIAGPIATILVSE